MGRTASGRDVLDKAKDMLAKARTVDELRQAQAVILPLEFGLSMEQVAAVTGVSRGWACQLRNRFIRAGGEMPAVLRSRGGRRRQNMSKEEEEAFLAPFLEKAIQSGTLMAGEIKQALDHRLGRQVSMSSVYNLLHRHHWRQRMPDKKYMRSEAKTRAEREENVPDPLP